MPRKSKISVDKIVVALKGMNFFDNSGKFCPFTDEVWQEASDRLDGQMNKKYIYLYIVQNRNSILNDLLTREEYEKFIASSEAVSVEECNQSNWSLESLTTVHSLRTQFVIPKDIWKQIEPEARPYSNREYNILKPGWTDVLYAQLWNNFKLPCSFSFKNGKVSTTPGDYFFKIHANCTECGNTINLYSLYGPDINGLQVYISSHDTRNIPHKKKRQLKSVERKSVVRELKLTSTYNWRHDKANNLMKFGDVEPPHIYKESVLRKAKQLDNDKELGIKGITDPIYSIIKLKYGLEFSGCLKEIGIDKFFVMYWSPEQSFIYKTLSKKNQIYSVSIDATGSLVAPVSKPDSSNSPIFIYQAVTTVNNKILPIFQMISEKHDSNMLSYWMREWLRSGVPCPQVIVTDYSLALLNASTLVFNNIDLASYVEQCFEMLTSTTGKTPPVCILRIDIAHIIKLVCRWKCFKRTPKTVKDFFIRCIGLMTHCGTTENFYSICLDVLSVAFSKTEDVTNSSEHCFAAQQRLLGRIKTVEAPSEPLENKSNFSVKQAEVGDNLKIGSRLQKFLEKLESESQQLLCGDRPNPYFCAEFGKNLLRISKHFVLWTNVMSTRVATSACSEEYFRQLKKFVGKGVKSIRIDKFLIMHLRSISGLVKLLNTSTSDESIVSKQLINESQNETNSSDEDSHGTLTTIINLSPFQEINCSITTEKANLLNEVESWKSLNLPPKKRGKYLTPCPDVEKIYQRPIFNRALPVLQNGTALQPIKVGQQVLRILNTCPFDTIVQSILSAYCDYSCYHDYITVSVNPTLEFVKMLCLKGISNKIYTQRAEILCKIVTPKNGILDCANNVSSLVSRHLLKNEPSLERREICDLNCGHEESTIYPVLKVSSMPFYVSGMKGLQGAESEFCEMSNRKCKRCKGDIIMNWISEPHIFIDIESLEWPQLGQRLGFEHRIMEFAISEIPIELIICNTEYKLVAAIVYSGGSRENGNGIGHYYSFIRRIIGKWEIHDDLNSKRKPLFVSPTKLLQKQRIHMLYYVKDH